MTFDSGNTVFGLVVAGCSTISWSNNAKWARTQPAENITTVHVVFMTHLDIGFTKLARDVCEQYFFQHYPRGIALSQELRQMGGAARYAVTTHPWLIQEYFDAATQCAHTTRNASMIKLMTDAIDAGGEFFPTRSVVVPHPNHLLILKPLTPHTTQHTSILYTT
jgi:hypothetical protein